MGCRVGEACPGDRHQGGAAMLEPWYLHGPPLERAQVAAIERLVEPFDRARVVESPGHRRSVSAYQVDLGVERAVPPAADGAGLGPGQIVRSKRQGFSDDRLYRAAPPRRPSAADQRRGGRGSPAPGQFVRRPAHRQVEAQAAVGHPVERRFPCLDGQRLIDGQHVLVADQSVQHWGQRPGWDRACPAAGLGRDVGMRPVAATDGLDYPAGGVRRGKFREQRRLGNTEQRGRGISTLTFGELQRRKAFRPGPQNSW